MLNRVYIAAFFALASLFAHAKFDSEAWNAKCADEREINRLKAEYEKCLAATNSAADNIELPIEQYESGKIKSTLKAAKAQMFLSSGIVWGEGITVEQYDENGQVTASLTADNCIVDRKSKSGWVEGNAHMDWDGTSIKGRGIYFSFDREFIKIFSQTEIRTKALKLSAGKVLEK